MAHSRIKISLLVFLFANIVALAANGLLFYQAKSLQQGKDERNVRLQNCVFKNVPSNLLRYEVSERIVSPSSRRHLVDFQIDQGGLMAKRIDIVVNQPTRPVVLYLNNYDPTIWVVHRTKGTEIYAVLANGYHRQHVAGIDDNTPVILSSNDNRSLCRDYRMEDAAGVLTPFSAEESSYRRGMLPTDSSPNDPIILGDRDFLPKDLMKYTGDIELEFKDAGPLAGEAGIRHAVEEGILVKLTPAERNEWQEKISTIEDGSFSNVDRPPLVRTMHESYLVVSKFRVPSGLNGAHAKTFIVKKGVSASAWVKCLFLSEAANKASK